MSDIESQFQRLIQPFEVHLVFRENMNAGRTFASHPLIKRHKTLLEVDSFLKENKALLLTSSNTHVREVAATLCSSSSSLDTTNLWGFSARQDIDRIIIRSRPLDPKSRAARYTWVMRDVYLLIKQALTKRHWETTSLYFKDVKNFAKYVKSCEQSQGLSEQDKQDLEDSIDTHINSSSTGLKSF